MVASATRLARVQLEASTRACLSTAQRASVQARAASTSSASSSSSAATSWEPPIAPGTEVAYDEALKYISTQQSRLRQRIPSLEQAVKETESGTPERSAAEEKLKSFIIASQINDPETRWRFENDKDAPLSNPVFAHLREKTWRQARLPRLIERIQLMKVLPDALYTITPSADLQLSYGEGEGIHDHGGEGGDVVPGCFVDVAKSMEAPSITATTFHPEERLYTVAMVDADMPYEAEQRIGTYAHLVGHNIPLSLTKSKIDMNQSNLVHSYIPPHPQSGTKYHRYVTVLYQQQDKIDAISTPTERHQFSLYSLAKQHALTPAGIHFFRAEYNDKTKDAISQIYKTILQQPEPKYIRSNADKLTRSY